MEHTITEADILDFLDKLSLFTPNLGTYEYHSSNEHFQYLIKTDNHSIVVSMEQLIANEQKQLIQEDFRVIAKKLEEKEKTSEPVQPVKTSISQKSNSGFNTTKVVLYSLLGVILIIAGIGIYGEFNRGNDYKSELDQLFDKNDSDVITETVYEEPKTEAELREDLYNVECKNPAKYINGNLKMVPIYKNLLSLKVIGIKLKGSLVNNATLATFKNVKIKVSFKSATGSVLFSKVYEVYDFVGPQGTIEYVQEIEVTNQEYEDIADFSWGVLSAEY